MLSLSSYSHKVFSYANILNALEVYQDYPNLALNFMRKTIPIE